jgi:hypothetical protein
MTFTWHRNPSGMIPMVENTAVFVCLFMDKEVRRWKNKASASSESSFVCSVQSDVVEE